MAVLSFNLLNIFMTAILNSVNSYFFISLRSFSCDLFLWMSHISLLFACLDIFCQNLGMWKTNYFSQSLWHSSEQGGTSSVSLARESSDLWSLFRECVFSGLVCLISLLKRFAKSQSGVPHTVCMSSSRFWNTWDIVMSLSTDPMICVISRWLLLRFILKMTLSIFPCFFAHLVTVYWLSYVVDFILLYARYFLFLQIFFFLNLFLTGG